MSSRETLTDRLRAVGAFMKSQTGVEIAIFDEAAIEIERLRCQIASMKPLSMFSDFDLRTEVHARALRFLGDQTEGVTIPTTALLEGDGRG